MSTSRQRASSAAAILSAALLTTVLLPTAGATEESAEHCDPFDTAACVLPFPNDQFTVDDPTTDTGKRIDFDGEALPANVLGTHIDPAEWNRNDGFSPGSVVLTAVPGLDLDQTGAAPITDIGGSLSDDAPIVLLNTRTGERHPYWAELDARADDPDRTLLMIRPARNLDEGTRYIVALRDLRDSGGALIDPPDEFAGYVSGRPPDFGEDPHDLPRNHPAAQEQKDVFLRTGEVIDTCGATSICPPE